MIKNRCNLTYLSEMTGGKRQLIKEIIDVFLLQVPEELKTIKDAILKDDFITIRKFAHTMKSSVSIMGISSLSPILNEMEELSKNVTDGSTPISIRIEKIKQLNEKLNSIAQQAMEEIESEKHNYN